MLDEELGRDLPRLLRGRVRVVGAVDLQDARDGERDDPGARAVLKSEAQVARLKVSLEEWLEGLFTGPYDESYFEKRARIGRVHVKVGLEQRYMLAAMNVIRNGLHAGLAEVGDASADAELERRAVDQICDIELAIMLETYRSCLQDVFDLPSLRDVLGQ